MSGKASPPMDAALSELAPQASTSQSAQRSAAASFKPARTSLIETSHLITILCTLAVLLVIFRVMQAVPELGSGGVVVDFDAFYITGQMFWEGRLIEAYDSATVQARQSALASVPIFMPWTYPPQFNLVVAALPLGARGTAYVLFMCLSFALFLYPLWRLAGRYTAGVLIATVPTLCFNTYVGQNGFISAGLLGFAALLWLRNSDRAGVPLGLMVIKPHLAVTMGLFALCTPRWGVVAWAAVMVVASSLLATLVFGPEIWSAFLSGTAAAKANMAQGSYPLYRMTSVYAALKSLGIEAGAALGAHLLLALAGLGATIWAARFSGWAPRRALGFAMLLSLVISPYSYDYDTTIMAMGLAILAADLIERGRPYERLCLLVLSWATGGAGLTLSLFTREESQRYGVDWFPYSLGAWSYLPLIALVWLMLSRIHAEEADPR